MNVIWPRPWGPIEEKDLTISRAPLAPLIWRKEEFGAIAYEPVTQRIFKLNSLGAEVLARLLEQKPFAEIQTELELEKDALDTFINSLRELALWKD